MIKIKDIYKSYGEKENKVEVLKGINLNIEDGDFVVILGPSGSGKSSGNRIWYFADSKRIKFTLKIFTGVNHGKKIKNKFNRYSGCCFANRCCCCYNKCYKEY